jgi:hypothetical protein
MQPFQKKLILELSVFHVSTPLEGNAFLNTPTLISVKRVNRGAVVTFIINQESYYFDV